MNEQEYNQIKFFLYNYKNIEKLIEERKSELISRINVSNVNYLKGLKEDTNTLENTIWKIDEDVYIRNLKRWRVCLKNVLAFLVQKNPRCYKYYDLKFNKKKTKEEITEALKIDFNEQKLLKDKLIAIVYKSAKIRNLF